MTSHIDINGFKEIKDNPISCVGVFPYLGKDLPGAADPTKIYYVYRPEEELADPDCINSFKLLPWVDDHTMLGGDYTPAEKKGVHGVLGEDIYYRDGVLRANLKIFSSMLERLIASGKKELSCGYRCMYEAAQGVFNGKPYDYIQRKIRGNHLALVDEGRMGPQVAVLDKVDTTYTFTIDSKGLQDMAEETKTEEKQPEMTLSELIAVVQSIVPQIAKMNEAMAALTPKAAPEAVVDEEKPKEDAEKVNAMDSKIKALQSELDSLKSNATKQLLGEVSKRNALYQKLSTHVGAFDHADMTEQEMAAYGVKKLGIACDSGTEVSAINGYLHNRTIATKTPVATDAAPKGVVLAYINGDK